MASTGEKSKIFSINKSGQKFSHKEKESQELRVTANKLTKVKLANTSYVRHSCKCNNPMRWVLLRIFKDEKKTTEEHEGNTGFWGSHR